MMIPHKSWLQIHLQRTCSSMASLMLRWRASLVPWQAIFTPFMSWVMLSLTCVEEIFPPHKPGWFVTPPSLISGIPSLYQPSRTGGLLELESQNRLASVPAVNAFGSMRIFKVSGKTVREEEKKFLLGTEWARNIIIMTTTRGEKKILRKVFPLFVSLAEGKVADRTE